MGVGLLDLVAQPGQRIAYLFPEIPFKPGGTSQIGNSTNGGLVPRTQLDDVFVFQFWPQQVQDRYQVNYATKQIPGASHPLYQWTGGAGRTISFEATFVSELAEIPTDTSTTGFRARIQADTGVLGSSASSGLGNALGAALLPSSRYTVNVSAALAALQRYLYGSYHDTEAQSGITEPPRKLVLVLPGTKLGRAEGNDGVLCILMGADVTMESWFPTGELRAATVSLEFAEIIQYTSGQGTKIKYIGAEKYDALARQYTFSGQRFSDVGI